MTSAQEEKGAKIIRGILEKEVLKTGLEENQRMVKTDSLKRGVFPGGVRRTEQKEVCVPDRWRDEPSLHSAF